MLRRVSAWCHGLDHYAMLLVMATTLTYSLQPFTLVVLADAVDNGNDFVAGIRLLAIALMVSTVAFSLMMVYLRHSGYFSTDVLDPRLFELAYWLAITVWIWPLLALVLSFVIGPFALVPIVIYVLIAMVPIEPLSARQDEAAAAPR